jgi:hypothetical protein
MGGSPGGPGSAGLFGSGTGRVGGGCRGGGGSGRPGSGGSGSCGGSLTVAPFVVTLLSLRRTTSVRILPRANSARLRR